MSPVYTREEVRKHNNEKTLWMVIHNDVYDVTKFLNEHPGGEETLLEFAGKDSTVAFENVGHSDDARELMAKFKIGTVPPGEQSRHAMSWPNAMKSDYMPPGSPRVEPRVQTIVVPREKERIQRPPPPSGSQLKWVVLALGAAIVMGVVIKKYMT